MIKKNLLGLVILASLFSALPVRADLLSGERIRGEALYNLTASFRDNGSMSTVNTSPFHVTNTQTGDEFIAFCGDFRVSPSYNFTGEKGHPYSTSTLETATIYSNLQKQQLTDLYGYPIALRDGNVGVGQAGCNMALIEYLLGNRSTILANAAESDLESIPYPIPKVLLSRQGTAKDRELGRRFAQERELEIQKKMERIFNNNVNRVKIYMSLGGGTGSGAGPEVIRIAREYILERGGDPKSDVIAVMVMPTPSIDGDKPCFNALKAYGEIDRLRSNNRE